MSQKLLSDLRLRILKHWEILENRQDWLEIELSTQRSFVKVVKDCAVAFIKVFCSSPFSLDFFYFVPHILSRIDCVNKCLFITHHSSDLFYNFKTFLKLLILIWGVLVVEKFSIYQFSISTFPHVYYRSESDIGKHSIELCY